MDTPAQQKQGRRIMEAIRRILVEAWDPIGIRGSGPDDEYDAYITGLYRLLIREPTEAEVVAHLDSITMVPQEPTSATKRKLRTVARKLLGVDLAIQ